MDSDKFASISIDVIYKINFQVVLNLQQTNIFSDFFKTLAFLLSTRVKFQIFYTVMLLNFNVEKGI